MTGRAPTRLQIATLVVIGGLAAGAAATAIGFPARARVYPLTVAVAALVLALLEAFKLGRRRAATPEPADVAPPLTEDLRRALPYVAWGIGFYGLIWTVGLVSASVVFVAAFLGLHGRVRWPMAVAAGVAVGAGLVGLGLALDLRWPRALFDLLLLTGLF